MKFPDNNTKCANELGEQWILCFFCCEVTDGESVSRFGKNKHPVCDECVDVILDITTLN